ncbi:SPW repeat protein [Denitratisoma oestradiolicum]|uniref:SPW repeat protein n=1 Tax=Denitratisoma oestradiolicum TaxID=311182 RepID=A0A6S6XSX4_9PROT|nr:SPW repeat protein [Denitratisoma oestradiolicum]TWO81134.1 hypothetical protein CBW56_05880 [Denitratisoma oestradiolicum]CAB1367820.1 SPW repeat protein [Denitratisoma oestradiolicum]
MKTQQHYWQETGTLIVGIWLFLSPWVFRFFHWADMDTMNFLVMGVAIAVVAVLAKYMHALWEDWVTLALGAWMILSPWILGFTDNPVAFVDAVIAGLFVVGIALSATYRDMHLEDKGAVQ